MENEVEVLITEIEAAAAALPREVDEWLEAEPFSALGERVVDWRRSISALTEGALRDRAVWALLGAERCLREAAEAVPSATSVSAARIRLEAASRALRALLPTLQTPPAPLP